MSTNRYLNAGGPGATTTIGNMASRLKVVCHTDQAGVPATVKYSLNVSSLTDSSVGQTYPIFTAPMVSIPAQAIASYVMGIAGGYGQMQGGTALSMINQIRQLVSNYSNSPIEATGAMNLMAGDLA